MSTESMNDVNQPQSFREKPHDPKSIVIWAAIAAALTAILLLGVGPIIFPPQAAGEQTESINDLESYVLAVQLDAEFDTSRTQLLRYEDAKESGCSYSRAPEIEGYTLSALILTREILSPICADTLSNTPLLRVPPRRVATPPDPSCSIIPPFVIGPPTVGGPFAPQKRRFCAKMLAFLHKNHKKY